MQRDLDGKDFETFNCRYLIAPSKNRRIMPGSFEKSNRLQAIPHKNISLQRLGIFLLGQNLTKKNAKNVNFCILLP